MVGSAPLTRSLPETSEDMKRFPMVVEDEGGELFVFPKSLVIDSTLLLSYSGIITHMFSSSRTTSAIFGLKSGSSWQHLRARFKNFSTQSKGYDPMHWSITENISPASYATMT